MESNNIFVPKEDRDRFFEKNKNYIYVTYNTLNKNYYATTNIDEVIYYYNNDTMSYKSGYIPLELAFIFEFDQNFLAMNKIFSRNDPKYHKIVYPSFKSGDFVLVVCEEENTQEYNFGVVINRNNIAHLAYEKGGFDYLNTILNSAIYKILVVDREAYSFDVFKSNLTHYNSLHSSNENFFKYIDPDFKTYYKKYLAQKHKNTQNKEKKNEAQ